MFTRAFYLTCITTTVRIAFVCLFVFSLFVGLTKFYTARASDQADSITVDAIEKAVSILFPVMPGDNVTTTVNFAEMLKTNPNRRSDFLQEIGNAFIEASKTDDLQTALFMVLDNQPELSPMISENEEEDAPIAPIIIRIIIIIIFCLL